MHLSAVSLFEPLGKKLQILEGRGRSDADQVETHIKGALFDDVSREHHP
jgi:hypothetical protein